jgi:hypothetical protein
MGALLAESDILRSFEKRVSERSHPIAEAVCQLATYLDFTHWGKIDGSNFA